MKCKWIQLGLVFLINLRIGGLRVISSVGKGTHVWEKLEHVKQLAKVFWGVVFKFQKILGLFSICFSLVLESCFKKFLLEGFEKWVCANRKKAKVLWKCFLMALTLLVGRKNKIMELLDIRRWKWRKGEKRLTLLDCCVILQIFKFMNFLILWISGGGNLVVWYFRLRRVTCRTWKYA